jgi:outer membrane receptor protein involved in Fe transport
VITREDLEAAGCQNLGDAFRIWPIFSGGGLNPQVISAAGSQNVSSQSAAATPNLRGLGGAATLTLINGEQVAPAEGSGAVDVNMIPVAAVDRIEITTRGVSALYGSSAIAGVVNIILRKSFDGAGLSGVLGGATEGGNTLQHYTLAAGHSWSQANVFGTLDCARQQAILSGTTLLPRTQYCSTLFSGAGQLRNGIEATVLGVYTKRSAFQSENFNAVLPGLAASTQSDVAQYALHTTLTVPLSDSWKSISSAGLSANNVGSPESLTVDGLPYVHEGDRFDNRLVSAEASAAGTLHETRAGRIQMALGAGYNEEEFVFASIPVGEFSISRQRHIHFAFAQVTVPLLPAAPGAPDPAALKLDVALRSEQYSDVGMTTNPAIALTYTFNPDFTVSISWGTSFRAPSLLQEYGAAQATLEEIPDASAHGEQSLALLRFGGNSNLKPEVSADSMLELTVTPTVLPGATFQLSAYDIAYKRRIQYPSSNTGDLLADPNIGPFVARNPSQAAIAQVLAESQFVDLTRGQSAPGAAALIIDDRNQNIAQEWASGVDLLAKYERKWAIGKLEGSLDVAYLDLRQQVTSATPTVPLSGTVFYPPTWRGRSGLVWSQGRCRGAAFVNYTGRSRNTNTVVEEPIASWTTVDGQVGCTVYEGGAWGKLQVTVSGLNLFNREPPFVHLSQTGSAWVNYDSTNTTPVGRFLTVRVNVDW